jgi:hypothetical protein
MLRPQWISSRGVVDLGPYGIGSPAMQLLISFACKDVLRLCTHHLGTGATASSFSTGGGAARYGGSWDPMSVALVFFT